MKTLILTGYIITQVLIIFVNPLSLSPWPDSFFSKGASMIKTITKNLNFTQSWSFYSPIYFKQPKYNIKVYTSNSKIWVEDFPSLPPKEVNTYIELKEYEVDRLIASYDTPYYLLALKGHYCDKYDQSTKVEVSGKYQVLEDTQNQLLNKFKKIVQKNLKPINKVFICR